MALLVLSANAEQKRLPSKNSVSPALRNSDRKLTSRQELGLQLLKTVESESAGLQMDMRAFVQWQSARAYSNFDHSKADNLRKQAFQTTLSIDNPAENPNCTNQSFCAKAWLQESILLDIIKKSAPEAETLLPTAEGSIRDNIVAQLVNYYVGKRDFTRAQDLLLHVSNDKDYPFRAAAQLIKSLGKGRSADRLAVFTQALNNFKNYGSTDTIFSADFGSLIAAVWDLLPPDAVLEAIDELLNEAKSHTGTADVQVSLSAKGDSVTLNSMYQLRLFQLLPILQELDASRAQSLLRDNEVARVNLQRFPKGVAAVDSMRFLPADSVSGKPEINDELEARIRNQAEQVIESAEKDPKQALNDAVTLPISAGCYGFRCARVLALEGIARKTLRKHPTIAKSALDELLKLTDQLSLHQDSYLADVPQLYLTIGDEQGARSAIKSLSKIAEKVYAADNDPDNPNLAFKGTWPSSRLWRSCVEAADKISPELVHEIISGIPDEDIAVFQKITYANSLLGAPAFPMAWAEYHKHTSSPMDVP